MTRLPWVPALGAAESLAKTNFVANLSERRELFGILLWPGTNVPQRSLPLRRQGAATGQKWFWVLLPKQKGLGCRAETRHSQKIP